MTSDQRHNGQSALPRAYSTEGPKCPHCGYLITADESHYYDERYTSEQCPECDREYSVEVFNQTSWTTRAMKPANE